MALRQGRIFIFGALGYFKLRSLLESSRRLTSYKSALQALATFTEQVVPIHKNTTLFWIPTISGAETVIMNLTKKPAVRLSDNTPITYLFSSLYNCTVCKSQELALNKAPVLLTTRTVTTCYCSIHSRRSTGLLSAKSLKILSYFLAKVCSAHRIARLCSMPPRNKPAKNSILRNGRAENDVSDWQRHWLAPLE